MKKFLAILLAVAMMCALLSVSVWADEIEETHEEPEVETAADENTQRVEVPSYTDDIGDYYYYEEMDIKAYYRFNTYKVTAEIVGGGDFTVCDLEGNELTLSDRFDIGAYPEFLELIDKWVAEHAEYDDEGAMIPAVGIPGFALYAPVNEYEHANPGQFCNHETDESAPNTGIAFAVIPTVITAAFAVISKKK